MQSRVTGGVICVPSRIVISTINFLGCRLAVLSEMPRVNMKHPKWSGRGLNYATTVMQQDLWWLHGERYQLAKLVSSAP